MHYIYQGYVHKNIARGQRLQNGFIITVMINCEENIAAPSAIKRGC